MSNSGNSGNYDDYVAMQDGTVVNQGGKHQVEGAATASVHEIPITNDRVKTEPPARLSSCLVVYFNEVKCITKQSQYEGGLLLELELSDNRGSVETWLPKKLCNNLDLEAHSVCVWDKFMVSKMREFNGLAQEPGYYIAGVND